MFIERNRNKNAQHQEHKIWRFALKRRVIN